MDVSSGKAAMQEHLQNWHRDIKTGSWTTKCHDSIRGQQAEAKALVLYGSQTIQSNEQIF